MANPGLATKRRQRGYGWPGGQDPELLEVRPIPRWHWKSGTFFVHFRSPKLRKHTWQWVKVYVHPKKFGPSMMSLKPLQLNGKAEGRWPLLTSVLAKGELKAPKSHLYFKKSARVKEEQHWLNIADLNYCQRNGLFNSIYDYLWLFCPRTWPSHTGTHRCSVQDTVDLDCLQVLSPARPLCAMQGPWCILSDSYYDHLMYSSTTSNRWYSGKCLYGKLSPPVAPSAA